MVSDKLKQIIFKQLYKELSNVEIIPYKNSIYFIDRENKYWYFEYEKSGNLWWRYNFFTNFFLIFSLESDDYQKVMGDWVEEVLNCKVSTTSKTEPFVSHPVEEVLNCKVSTTHNQCGNYKHRVEEVLNCKVSTTDGREVQGVLKVEEVLNCKVSTTQKTGLLKFGMLEEVLNCKVSTTKAKAPWVITLVEDVLKVTN